jgi:hypothetical protein
LLEYSSIRAGIPNSEKQAHAASSGVPAQEAQKNFRVGFDS